MDNDAAGESQPGVAQESAGTGSLLFFIYFIVLSTSGDPDPYNLTRILHVVFVPSWVWVTLGTGIGFGTIAVVPFLKD